MILIGQFDSPFVRRVGIALRVLGLAFEHRPWSTFGDAELIAPYNPLCRVPVLVLDDEKALVESSAILDHIDSLSDPSKRLIPAEGLARRQALRVCALSTGLADKAVSLFYERALHEHQSDLWRSRCEHQIQGVLTMLDTERAERATPYWFGGSIGHADIALACALRFTADAHPSLWQAERWPALGAHAERCEAMPVFQEISQAFVPPK